MLGSGFEAEDAVQETMVRAWRGIDRFEGRSSLRSWLYRIATQRVPRHARRARSAGPGPMDLGPSSTADAPLAGRPARARTWVQPVADARVLPDRRRPGRGGGRHASRSGSRSSPRCSTCRPASARCSSCARCCAGRPARWPSCSTPASASVNSALQRARATLGDDRPRRRRSSHGRRRAAGAARPLRRRVRALRHHRRS